MPAGRQYSGYLVRYQHIHVKINSQDGFNIAKNYLKAIAQYAALLSAKSIHYVISDGTKEIILHSIKSIVWLLHLIPGLINNCMIWLKFNLSDIHFLLIGDSELNNYTMCLQIDRNKMNNQLEWM